MFNFYVPTLKILNFTHIDFDGVSSAIVVKNFYENVLTETINYGKEQEAFDKITRNMNNIDAVIFTDFCPVNIKQLRALGKPILVLDHHESALPFADPENGIYINTKYCGAMLTWKYFGAKKPLDHLQDLINITNDFDLFTLKDPRSMCFNALYWEMGFKWFLDRFITGNTNLYDEEKRFIIAYKKAVKDMYDNLPLVDLPHKGCMYDCEKYLAEMSHALAKDGYDYQIIHHGNSLSIRSNNDAINLVHVCQNVGKGGGHSKAAGVPIAAGEDIKQLTQKICYAIEHELNYGKELPF